MSMSGILLHMQKTWSPTFIVDVGAAAGSFTKLALKYFPASRAFLFEPVPAYRDQLEAIAKANANITYIPKAASDRAGELTFFIHNDLVGSSSKREAEGMAVDGTPTMVTCVLLDEAVPLARDLPVLLKIDVQGAELDVLRGATKLLEQCECIILEVSLFHSLIGGPDSLEVFSFMKERGFVLYDIAGLLYRPYDGALCQFDAVFVKDASRFRSFHGFATKEQREKQNKKFQEMYSGGVKK